MNFSSDQLKLTDKLISNKLHIYLQKVTKMQVNKYKGDSFQIYKCYNIPVEDQADHHSQSLFFLTSVTSGYYLQLSQLEIVHRYLKGDARWLKRYFVILVTGSCY